MIMKKEYYKGDIEEAEEEKDPWFKWDWKWRAVFLFLFGILILIFGFVNYNTIILYVLFGVITLVAAYWIYDYAKKAKERESTGKKQRI